MKDQELFTTSYEDRFRLEYHSGFHLLEKDCISQRAHEFSIEIKRCFSLTMGWARVISLACLRELKIIEFAEYIYFGV